MTAFIRSIALLALFAAGSLVSAQEFRVVPPYSEETPTPAEVTSLGDLTPEMWFYVQELRRYDDPSVALRRRAELTAAARRSRINAQKWYGISNARPSVNPVPFMYNYSIHRSNNTWDLYNHSYYRTSAVQVLSGRQF